MFSFLKKKSQEEQLRKNLFDFLAEMEKNLELFFVMDQRQFITNGFLTQMWPKVNEIDFIKKHEAILIYAKSTVEFNDSLKKYKDYEAWYTGDVNNKSPENARKLHAMKNDLDLKLRAMEAIIIPAGQELEREMLRLGLLKA